MNILLVSTTTVEIYNKVVGRHKKYRSSSSIGFTCVCITAYFFLPPAQTAGRGFPYFQQEACRLYGFILI